MEKIKILGISKWENRSQYDFPKEQKLFGIIREILYGLGFENGNYDYVESFGRPWSEETERAILDKEDNINSRDYTEKITSFTTEDYSLDIIFFSKKVVLIFHYCKDRQAEISKVINKFILDEE